MAVKLASFDKGGRNPLSNQLMVFVVRVEDGFDPETSFARGFPRTVDFPKPNALNICFHFSTPILDSVNESNVEWANPLEACDGSPTCFYYSLSRLIDILLPDLYFFHWIRRLPFVESLLSARCQHSLLNQAQAVHQ